MRKHALTLGMSIFSGLLFAVGSAAFGSASKSAGLSGASATPILVGFLMLGIAVCVEARVWHRLARARLDSRSRGAR